MDINEELMRILAEHPIEPQYQKIADYENISRIVRGILEEFGKECLLVSSSSYDVNEIVYKNGMVHSPVIILEHWDQDRSASQFLGCKRVVYISFPNHGWWKEAIKTGCPALEVIDLYEELERRGYEFDREYYEDSDHIRDPYADIAACKKELRRADDGSRWMVLQDLIYRYIEIRDMDSALSYMELYIENDCPNAQTMRELASKLRSLIGDIRTQLSLKKEKAVVMCWVDAIQYNEMNEMEFLRSEKEKTLCFDQAFTVTPYTVPTYFTIFCRKKCVEDRLHTYKHDRITRENSELIRYLEEEGYGFRRYGLALNLFEDENCGYGAWMNSRAEAGNGQHEFTEVRTYKELDCKEDICPVLLWKGLRDLVLQERPFVLLHIAAETHSPYICGEYEGDYVNDQFHPNTAQIDSARDYVDRQLRFYASIWGASVSSIIMSDHGKKVKSQATGEVYQDIFHTMLMVKGADILPGRCSRLFSYLDFGELIKYVIHPEPQKLEGLFRGYVELQNLDTYGLGVITRLSAQGRNISKNTLLGYRAVRTKTSMLVRRNDDKLMYYRFPCLQNLYGWDGFGHQEDAESLLELLGDLKPDLNEGGDFFQYTRVIYKALQIHDKRAGRLQKQADVLIDELFQSFSGRDIVALRGGGEAANEIIRRVGASCRISYIIDNAVTCRTGLPGYTYITEQEIPDKNISKVIITSYSCRHEMYKALENRNHDCEIIDLYQYFEEKGLTLGEDYHADKISPKDIQEVLNVTV